MTRVACTHIDSYMYSFDTFFSDIQLSSTWFAALTQIPSALQRLTKAGMNWVPRRAVKRGSPRRPRAQRLAGWLSSLPGV